MARRKPRKRKRASSQQIHSINPARLAEQMARVRLKQLKDDEPTEVLETFMGDIYIHPDAFTFSISPQVLGTMLLEDMMEDDDNEDILDELLFLEKMLERFPNEKQFAYQRAKAYHKLDREEKHEQITLENYERFSNHLPIDTAYGRTRFENEEINLREELFGDKLNPHEIYPDREFFDKEELLEYFMLQSIYHITEGKYDTAREFADLLMKLDRRAMRTRMNLRLEADLHENPVKYKLTRYAVIGGLILLAGGLIWGMIALIRWIIGLF